MSDAERHKILVEWNNTAAPYPSGKCVHQLIEEQAQRTPDAVAVEQEQRRLTYRELDERANQLAALLRTRKVGADVPVGICLKRSPELTIALLGVMKAGGACLPLDPDYPQDRLAYMLEDSHAPVLLTEPGLLAGPGNGKYAVVDFTPDWAILEGHGRESVHSPVTPTNLAYVIYTSGSTGKPRGVLLSHRGLVNHNTAAVRLYDIRPSDRVLQFSSISFDIAVEEIFPTWIAGGTVVLRTEQMPLAALEFLRWIEQRRITVLDVPTAYWHELVRELGDNGGKLPLTLRTLIVGGEKASASAYSSWLNAGGDRVRWFNTYGPTEASVIATAYEPDPLQPIPANLPIGRPIANVRLYILDEQLQPVPAGCSGELHIGGPGVARGYLNRPDLTDTKFIRNPFSNEDGARLYKTGDLVRYLADGNIEFIGRTDFQVKIRGFRVELGEIDAALETHAAVAGAVVIAREVAGEKRLTAYVVPAGTPASVAELRTFLKSKLPEYMVPAEFVFLDSFPLTPNGKVDRKALPEPRAGDAVAHDNFVAPRDAFEIRMAKLWEQVLGVHSIGVQQNFFELGGHSLLAIRLMTRIEKEFGKKLLITVLIQAPTIEKLAAVVRDEAATPWSAVVPLQPMGTRPPLFFVHGLGGTVLRFNDLSREMLPDQPFYGIQAQGLDGKQPCLSRVEDMVDLYYRHLRNAQPQGPYFLGGYSFGGLVALELARKCIAEGEEVPLVALVDTYIMEQQASDSLMGRFLSLSAGQKMAYMRKRARRYGKGIKRRVAMLKMPLPFKRVREACAMAEKNYQPRVYPGSIELFRASEKGLRGLDGAHGGWRRYAAGGLHIHEIAGDHGSIVNQPQVKILAAELRAAVDRAQAQYERGLMASEVS
ncbi:MAG TPA: amino acid adenylation domain-containing protein [Terriglobales bacterium]|nr:amino acid adenylation domain-containing protein [Terriglobales bacterium]